MPPSTLKEKEEVILVIGNMGGDAGYSVLTPHGIVHVPGNNPMAREAIESMMKGYTALQEIGLRERSAAERTTGV